LVKSKNHAVKPQCLGVLMSLRIKDINLDSEKQNEIRQKKLAKKERNLSMSKRDRKVTKINFNVISYIL
jgi:nucleolar complex protein 3